MSRITIDLGAQFLVLEKADASSQCFDISSAENGAGEQNGSFCTPRGKHIVRAKIGHNAALNTVFIGRRPSGEIYHPDLYEQFPERDWILTRILWLSGCEPGVNRLGDVDTMRRYVYIHGTPDEVPMGVTGSHGCIRMRNADVINLFDQVATGTPVNIYE